MINAVSGRLCYKGIDTIRVDNNGIEWEFFVSSRSIDMFGNLDNEVRVLCWLLHREDQMRLFGFPSEAERAIFLELLKVDGVGPKQALKILNGISAADLEAALENEDVARLETVPGLGKKTAQKLVFTLKGKLPHITGSAPRTESRYDDIARALIDMGYDRRRVLEAIKTVDAALPADQADRETELFRAAILELSSV